MSNTAQKITSLLVLGMTFTSLFVHPTLGQLPGLIPGVPTFPGIPSFPGTPDLANCWSSLNSIPGCWMAVTMALFGGAGNIGPACCNALLSVEDNCWPKMFPQNPFFAPLRDGCARTVGVASPPPSPVAKLN